MATSINKVTLLGRLGHDPEFVALSGGAEMAKLSLATSHYIKKKGGNTDEYEEVTAWHNIVVFNKHLIPPLRNHAKKGSKIYVEGELNYRQYETKDKIKKTQTEIVVTDYKGSIILLDKREKSPEEATTEKYSAVGYEEMPF